MTARHHPAGGFQNALLDGFGKDQSGYYAFDTRGRALTHGNRSIQDVLTALQTTRLAVAS